MDESARRRVRACLQELASGRSTAGDADGDATGSGRDLDFLAADWRPRGSGPPDLAGRACPLPAPLWHLRELRRLLSGDRSAAERSAYHASWLLYLLFGDDPRFQPKVSVIIPVYNGASYVADAVRSALQQSWGCVEVIVVDDGSTDDLDAVLAPHAARIRLLRKANGGVSSARNAGILAATGELLHFLDADDILDPACVETKLSAFEAVADAELCVSGYRIEGDAPHQSAPPRMTGPDAATADLLIASTMHYPFHTSTVMIPRYVAHETGFFDERLPRSEDVQYWFRLALRGTKVIGIDRPLNTRRFVPGSLTHEAGERERYWVRIVLENFVELLAHPQHWPLAGTMMIRLRGPTTWTLIDGGDDPALEEARGALLRRIGELDDLGRTQGLSARPLLVQLRNAVRQGIAESGSTGFFRTLEQHLHELTKTASPLSEGDVEQWLEKSAGLPRPRNLVSARGAVLRWLHREAISGRGQRSCADLLRLSRCCHGQPLEERWRTAARLERLAGRRAARLLLRVLERLRPVEAKRHCRE